MNIIFKKTLHIFTVALFLLVTATSAFTQWSQNADNIWNTVNTKKVGIGTATPGATLQIGAGTGNLHVGNIGVLLKPNTGDRALMELHSPDGSNRLVLQSLPGASHLASLDAKPLVFQNSGGNVGIGTANPSTKLDVNGDLKVEDELTVYGTTMIAGDISLLSNLSLPYGYLRTGKDAEINGVPIGRGNGGGTAPTISNIAIGLGALKNNASDGYGNIAIGQRALENNFSGKNNTALGYDASKGYFIGSNNTFLGYSTGGTSGVNNSAAVGSGAFADASNKIRLGDIFVEKVETQFKYTTISDGRFKNNVREEDIKGLEFIKKLRPVAYNFDTRKFQEHLTQNMSAELKQQYMNKDFSNSTNTRRSGFIAQEVEKAAQEAGYDFDGVSKPQDAKGNYSLAYSQFTVPLVKAVQELSKQNDSLENKIQNLENKLNTVIQQMTELKTTNTLANADLPVGKGIGSNNASDIMIYPNPANSSFTLATRYELKDAKIQLLDMLGNAKYIFVQDADKYSKKINFGKLPSGMYWIILTTPTKTEKTKIIIQ